MYNIIDNFLDQNDADKLEKIFLSTNFNWKYISTISYQSEYEQNDISKFYFAHMLFTDYRISSEYYNYVIPIINKLNVKAIWRIKANLYTTSPNIQQHDLHIDMPFEAQTAIYYVNSNDGYTYFENGTAVNSVKNRILIMNKNIKHASTNCTDKKTRCTINFNYF
jgi:hypothetical protein